MKSIALSIDDWNTVLAGLHTLNAGKAKSLRVEALTERIEGFLPNRQKGVITNAQGKNTAKTDSDVQRIEASISESSTA